MRGMRLGPLLGLPRRVCRALGRKIAFSLASRAGRLRAFAGRRPRLAAAFSLAARAGAIGTLAGGAGLLLCLLALWPFTPGLDDIRKTRLDRPSVLLSADGQELAAYRRLNREWVPLKDIPGHVVDALVATEDRRFRSHWGIDPLRTVAAFFATLRGERQGGSTLTQQLARNLFPDEIGRAPTLTRKLREAVTAIKLEYAWSKDQILETYLNTVPFLYNADGIEMAARTYFNTGAARLDVLQGATLVGMLKGTAYYNPVLNPDRALFRRNLVLSRMVREGALTPGRYDSLRRRPLGIDFERQVPDPGPAPHFAEQVRRWLLAWAERNGYDIHADGLVVHSTLDSRLQRLASQVVARQLDLLQAVADVEWGREGETLLSTEASDYLQARRRIPAFRHFWRANPQLLETFVRESPEFARLKATGDTDAAALAQLLGDAAFLAALRDRKTRLEAGFVALDPRTGAVRAWVGSRDFSRDRYDHVAQARRQPGSTFKPFVYAAALEAGMRPEERLADRAVAIRLAGGGFWQPGDMHGAGGGELSLRDGLVFSRNAITAQVMERVGPRKVARLAQRAGVRESRLDPVPSLALGTSPVTLLEMAGAYGSIAALGRYAAPAFVTRITDRKGRLLAEFRPEPERVLDEGTAIELVDMLRGVVDRGTGRGLRRTFGIAADVAGKTGTTQNNADGWFILMHPQLVAGAWVGFNDPRVRMRSDHWGQGAHNALYVVGDFFRQALAARAVDGRAAFPARGSASLLEAGVERAGLWLRDFIDRLGEAG